MASGAKKAFENIVEKGKMLVASIFSFSHNVFLPVKDKKQHWISCLQMLLILSSLKFCHLVKCYSGDCVIKSYMYLTPVINLQINDPSQLKLSLSHTVGVNPNDLVFANNDCSSFSLYAVIYNQHISLG